MANYNKNSAAKYAKERGNNGNNLPVDLAAKIDQELEKRQKGRASKFTPETAGNILEEIANGGTIDGACKKAGITRMTFYAWQNLVPHFSELVKQARVLQAHSMADDGVSTLENVDVENADPKQAMALLRRAEQVTRFKFDLAKCFSPDTYNPASKNVNVNINAQVSDADISSWFNR